MRKQKQKIDFKINIFKLVKHDVTTYVNLYDRLWQRIGGLCRSSRSGVDEVEGVEEVMVVADPDETSSLMLSNIELLFVDKM